MSIATGGGGPTSLFGATIDRNDVIAYDPESGATWQVLDGNGLFSVSQEVQRVQLLMHYMLNLSLARMLKSVYFNMPNKIFLNCLDLL